MKPALIPPTLDDVDLPVFTGCARCLDTGWAFLPHSDEARERCDCKAKEPSK